MAFKLNKRKELKRSVEVVMAIQIGSRIYVLHAFQKKSKRGVETPKRDVDLIQEAIRGSEGAGA